MSYSVKKKIAISLWLISLSLLLIILTAITTAWLVRNSLTGGSMLNENQRDLIIKLSKFPGMINIAIKNTKNLRTNASTSLLIARESVEKKYWARSFPSKDDSGYLLLSALDKELGISTVDLIKISDGSIIKRWTPDWSYIIRKTTHSKYSTAGLNPREMRAFHPLLLESGEIIFNTGGALVRMGICNSRPQWVLDEVASHSVEIDKTGNIWTISSFNEGFRDNKTLHNEIREDAIAEINLSGQLIRRISFAKILRDNDFSWLLMGMNGFNMQRDPIHLNQISIASEESKFWKIGDLLISARHLSTIFLYRPTSGKIIWSKSGPWMNQHSVRFINNHQISVFDNNVYSGAPTEQPFLTPGDTNKVLVYDFTTNAITEPYLKILEQERPVTLTEGRAQILPDGGLFLEESNQGRHLRFDREKLLWSRVNDFDENNIGIVSWSRYLTASEAFDAVSAINQKKCNDELM